MDAVARLCSWRKVLALTRFHSIATTVGVAVLITLTACGETAVAGQPSRPTFFPTNTPGASTPAASASPTAAAGTPAPAAIGQGQPNGLGTPAQTVSQTADLKFNPATTTAKAGEVVQWTNSGSVPHNVTFDGNDAITSGSMAKGDTWQVKITAPGTYKYHCTFHPGMDGTLTIGG